MAEEVITTMEQDAPQEVKKEAKKTVRKSTAKTTPIPVPAAPAAPFRLFFRPVRADEIDVRVQSCKFGKVTLLLYKDARCDMNILDETVGCMNWQRHHSRDNANCTVSIWDDAKQQWIEKEDTGTESQTEAEKGLASDSFKRACFNLGIGRELYTTPLVQIPVEFLKMSKDGSKPAGNFVVLEMDVSVDEQTGQKRITRLKIGQDYYGKSDWVWAWTADDGTGKPKMSINGKNSLITGQASAPQNQSNAPAQQNAPAPAAQPAQAQQQNGWGSQQGRPANTGWGSQPKSQPQKGSFGHGQGEAPKRQWRNAG